MSKRQAKARKTKRKEDLYEEFMEAVDKADAAKTKKTRDKYIDIAAECYDKMEKAEDLFRPAQLKRARRIMKGLKEGGESDDE